MYKLWCPKEDLYGPIHWLIGEFSKYKLKLLPKLLFISNELVSAKFLPRKNGSEFSYKRLELFKWFWALSFELLLDEKNLWVKVYKPGT